MDRVYQSAAANSAPAIPQQPVTGFPTDGDQATNTPATQPGEWWFHQVTESLVRVIEDAGLTPDHTDLDLLANSVRMLSNKNVLTINGNRTLTVNDAGAIFIDAGAGGATISLPQADLLLGMEFEFTVVNNGDASRILAFGGDTVDGGIWPHSVDKHSTIRIKSDGVDTWHRLLSTPIATVSAFAGEASASYAAPAGWFYCDGQAVSRAYWPDLFDAIGTTYGVGDGSTTFNLPDLRGEFVRGWDDGKGADAGRVRGSSQLDALQNIVGGVEHIQVDETTTIGPVTGPFGITDNGSRGSSSAGGSPGVTIDFDASRSVRTAGETRPRNVAMIYCIKH